MEREVLLVEVAVTPLLCWVVIVIAGVTETVAVEITIEEMSRVLVMAVCLVVFVSEDVVVVGFVIVFIPVGVVAARARVVAEGVVKIVILKRHIKDR